MPVAALAARPGPAAAQAGAFPYGLAASTLAHGGALLWVAFGALFFAADPAPQMAGVEVSLISGAAFDALMARSAGETMLPEAALAPEVAVTPPAHSAPAALPPVAARQPAAIAPASTLAKPPAVYPVPKAALPVAVSRALQPLVPPAPAPAAPAPVIATVLPVAFAPAGPEPTVVAPTPQADVAETLTPPIAPVAPVTPEVASVPAPPTLQPLPDLPEAQEAGPDTPRPRRRPDPAARAEPQVAEAPRQQEPRAAPKPAKPAPQQAEARPKPASASDGAQEVNARRGAAEGAKDGASDQGRAGAKGKAAGNAAASNYGGEVLRKISRTRKPKAPARGTVVIGFSIAANGGLAGAKVLRSSGAPALDAVALDHIRRAAPFPAPPEGAKRSFSFEFVGRP